MLFAHIYSQINDIFIIKETLLTFLFTPVHNIIFGVTFAFLSFFIFLHASKIYSDTSDKRYIIIGTGFLTAAIFEIIHFLYSHNNTVQFYYLFFENTAKILAFLLPLLYLTNPISSQPKIFKRHVYFGFLVLFIAAIALQQLIQILHLSLTAFYPSMRITFSSLFLLVTLIYSNIRIENNRSPFCRLTLGLFLSGLSEFYIPMTFYITSDYRLILHILNLLGLILIFTGLKDISFIPKIFSIKQKLLIIPLLFLIAFYLVMIFISTEILGFHIPNFVNYFFLFFFLISVIIQFFLAKILTKPLSNIIQSIEKTNPRMKPENIPVTTRDEIGILTADINEKTETNWIYLQEQTLIREIIQATMSTLDLNRIFEIVCEKLGKLFNIDSVRIIQFIYKDDIIDLEFKYEYKVQEDTKEITDVSLDKRIGEYVINSVLKEGITVINNLQEYPAPDFYKEIYKELGAKSLVIVPIQEKSKIWGALILSQIKNFRHWTNEELNVLNLIANQLFIAITQADLYSSLQKKVQQESFLRNVISTIRSSLDINEVISMICENIAKAFNVQRTSIVEFLNRDDYSEWVIRSEYKQDKDIKGVINNINFNKHVGEIWAKVLSGEKKYLAISNMQESNLPDHVKKTYTSLGQKSILVLPIKSEKTCWGVLILSEYNYYRTWTQDEITLLQTITAQIYLAITQAELFSTTKTLASKAKLAKEIISTIRSSMNIEEIKNKVVTEIGRALDASRCFIVEYDNNTNTFLTVKNEYLASTDYKSMIGFDSETGVPHLTAESKKVEQVIIEDVDEYLKTLELQDATTANHLRLLGVKSGFSVPIYYYNTLLGILVLHFNKARAFAQEELDFINDLAGQVGTAIYQSKLYNAVKQNAENERILRETISGLRTPNSIDQLFEYILPKISNIFNAYRVFFVQIPSLRNERACIKYEYIIHVKYLELKKDNNQNILLDALINMLKNAQPVAINDISTLSPNNENFLSFVEKYSIKSALILPVVRYTPDIEITGMVVLCINKEKNWSSEEINLGNNITYPLTTTYWDIVKRQEIDELRNIFILTLAHDLQMPLVGERNALMFLASRTELSKYHEMIKELIKNNHDIYNLLTRLIHSYNYESSKKELNCTQSSITDIINNVVNNLHNKAQEKAINIKIEIGEGIPFINVDRNEISTALYNLVENAIIYIQNGGEITIKAYRESDDVIVSVSDNGPGIAPNIKERIFERYAMAQSIERKVGSGLGLYLAKQIITAHKGKIWYTTELGKGTTFYFSLPVI